MRQLAADRDAKGDIVVKARLFTLVTLCSCLPFLVATQARSQRSPAPKPIMTQTRNGVVLSILAIERTKVWEQKMWADAFSKPSTGESYNAKSGEEWIVCRIRIKCKSNRVSYKHLELLDAAANTYKSLLLEIFWEAPEGKSLDVVNEIPFGVPAGTRIKSLRIEDFSFDLENIANSGKG